MQYGQKLSTALVAIQNFDWRHYACVMAKRMETHDSSRIKLDALNQRENAKLKTPAECNPRIIYPIPVFNSY
jgi:hypothetical protein